MVEAALTRFSGVLAFFPGGIFYRWNILQPLGLQAGSCSYPGGGTAICPHPGGAARLGGGAKEEQLHARG